MLLKYRKGRMQVLTEGHAEHAQDMEVISVEITRQKKKKKRSYVMEQPSVINYGTGLQDLDIKVAELGFCFSRARADAN